MSALAVLIIPKVDLKTQMNYNIPPMDEKYQPDHLRREETPANRIIALDFDDTMFNFMGALVKHRNELTGSNFSEEDFKTYIFEDVWGGSFEETIKFLQGFYQTPEFAMLEPLPGMIESLEALSEKNDFTIITARNSNLEHLTLHLLDEYIPGLIKEVHYTNHYTSDINKQRRTKAEVCKQIGAELIIEDSDVHAQICAQEGIQVILLDKPWNRKEFPTDITGIIRVNTWGEIVQYVSSLPETTL